MNSLLEHLASEIKNYSAEDQKKIMEAATWAKDLHKEQLRASGEPYIIHPLQVAAILIEMELDRDAIIAALLHDVIEDTEITPAMVRKRFGRPVENLVEGVTKISKVKATTKSEQAAETIRKMLFAMTKDIRVMIIKLADKYHNMSTLNFLAETKQKRIAQECLDIYAPIAGRLGISWLRAELEDLSLKYLNPVAYDHITEHLRAQRNRRKNYLQRVQKTLLQAAAKEKIIAKVQTRSKHIYSIYQKMKRRKKDIGEIFDILGIRILCSTTNECYTMLGLVHQLWPPIEGRFKDYIAMPKDNRYQSLHTTVMCFDGKVTEIQIRTHQMHQRAEFGVAAHWAYKKGMTKDQIRAADLMIISKLKKWNTQHLNSTDFLEDIKQELLKGSIYVFTPQGQIIELPKGATALDFAYNIHTEVGHHTIGAKADGSIIPLSRELRNTQVIEIMTSNTATPHLNWMKIVKTSRAKSKIRHWLNKHDESLIIDQAIIARKKAEPVAEVPDEKSPAPSESRESHEIIKRVFDKARVAFRIGDEKNMLINIAGCCNPSTGDDIIGYISRGRGIIVHRRNCPNLAHISEVQDRTIEVAWEGLTTKETHRFKVTSRMTSDLFSEIEGAVRKYKGHLIEGRLEEDERGNLTGSFTMEMEKNTNYKQVMKSIRTIPSVLNIISL